MKKKQLKGIRTQKVIAQAKYRMNRIYGSMRYLRWVLSLMALDISERRKTIIQNFLYLFRSISIVTVLTTLCGYTLVYKHSNVYPRMSASMAMTDGIEHIYNVLKYITDVYCVYKYGRHISYSYYKQYACFDRIVRVVNYSCVEKRLTKLLKVFGIIWSIITVFDLLTLNIGYGFVPALMLSLNMVFFFINTLTVVDFIAQTTNVECRLRMLGDMLQDLYPSMEDHHIEEDKKCFKDLVWNKYWFYYEERRLQKPLEQHRKMVLTKKLQGLTRCYLLLKEQCDYINNMYGLRMALVTISTFITIVKFINQTLKNVLSNSYVGLQREMSITLALTSTVHFLGSWLVLGSMTLFCEYAYRHNVRMLSIVTHMAVNKNPDKATRDVLKEMRDVMNANPIKFGIAHIRLGHVFFASLTSIALMYSFKLVKKLPY